LITLNEALVRSLLYFDIFSYPLTAPELLQVCEVPDVSRTDVLKELTALAASGAIGEQEGFYFVGDGPAKIERRLQGNALAAERLVKAYQVSRFIGKFPFVRAVMLSGSLSKNYMEEDSDIDYFIVTKPGRLWICRTLLILYKKIILLNSHENFCVNYFVDTDHLEIEDKNIFTATEVSFVVPTYNYGIYQAFREENAWTRRIYPNFDLLPENNCHAAKPTRMKRAWEWMLGGKLGEAIDTWCMKRTLKRWQAKFPDFDEESFEVALRSRKYVSKHHPRRFQQIVTQKLAEKEIDFQAKAYVRL